MNDGGNGCSSSIDRRGKRLTDRPMQWPLLLAHPHGASCHKPKFSRRSQYKIDEQSVKTDEIIEKQHGESMKIDRSYYDFMLWYFSKIVCAVKIHRRLCEGGEGMSKGVETIWLLQRPSIPQIFGHGKKEGGWLGVGNQEKYQRNKAKSTLGIEGGMGGVVNLCKISN